MINSNVEVRKNAMGGRAKMLEENLDEPLDLGDDDASLGTTEIRYLRREAYAVRDCFTRYSIQVLTASGAIMVVIAKFESDDHILGLLGFIPCVLLLAVLAMGMHKYATSNRLLGYELHLQRTAHYRERDGWHSLMRRVGWEEAMRAWRIVQPTLYERIYRPTGRVGKRLWIISIRPADQEMPSVSPQAGSYSQWFDQYKFLSTFKHVRYSSGGYLRSLMIIFFMSLGTLCLLPISSVMLLWAEYLNIYKVEASPSSYLWFDIFMTVLVLSVCLLIALRCINIRSRIRILEDGLLSIHSCAIVWEATILAHISSLQKLGFFSDNEVSSRSMHGYTGFLADEAKKISEKCLSIHDWIRDSRLRLHAEIRTRTEQPGNPDLFPHPHS